MSEPEHDLGYPYLRIDRDDQTYWCNAVEASLLAEDVLKSYGKSCEYLTELCMALRILEQQYKVNPKRSYFVDCLGNGGMGCFIALAYHYPRALTIEPSRGSFKTTMRCWERLKSEPVYKSKKLKMLEGSMQDYFPVDGSVYFLNATEISPDSGLDESILVYLFFQLCQKILSGTYLIIFTHSLQLDTIACREMNLQDVHCIHHEVPKDEDDYSYDLGPHCHIWILQTLPTTLIARPTIQMQKMIDYK